MPGLFQSFLKDARGVTALMFGLATPAIALAVGGGVDFSRAAARHQRMASAIELACQQAVQEIRYQAGQTGADPKKDYGPLVKDLAAKNLSADKLTEITATVAIVGEVVTITAAGFSPNVFGGLVGYNQVSLRVSRDCTKLPVPTSANKVLFTESFESYHNVASNSWTVLNNWNGWTTQSGKGGIEINGIRELAANTIRFGNFFAELDSHCYTSGCKTNSNMWREFKDLVPGSYELSYWYISRVRNPAYAGQALCAYKTDTKAVWDKLKAATWESQTNRIEVFIQRKKSGGYDAVTIDKNDTADLVDVCVHTDQWTERKISLNVTTKGTYRIYFQAAGREDTYGGLIDYIRFCSGNCP
jgi:Flp pilus assembly protein TadG